MKKKVLLLLSAISMISVLISACGSFGFSKTTLIFPDNIARTVSLNTTVDEDDTVFYIKNIEPPFVGGLKYIILTDFHSDGKLDVASFGSEQGEAIVVKAWAGRIENLRAEVIIDLGFYPIELKKSEAERFYHIGQELLSKLQRKD